MYVVVELFVTTGITKTDQNYVVTQKFLSVTKRDDCLTIFCVLIFLVRSLVRVFSVQPKNIHLNTNFSAATWKCFQLK